MTVSTFGIAHSATGATVYGIFRNVSYGGVYASDIDAFEAYSTANLQYYAISCAENGTASKFYEAQTPFGNTTYWAYQVKVNKVKVDFYAQAGGAPAEGDTHIGSQEIDVEHTYGYRSVPFDPYAHTVASYSQAGSIDAISFPGHKNVLRQLHEILGLFRRFRR